LYPKKRNAYANFSQIFTFETQIYHDGGGLPAASLLSRPFYELGEYESANRFEFAEEMGVF
jgi:hypothetical protein